MEKTQLQNYHVHYGPAQGWSRVDLRELWRYKDLIWLFVKRDFNVMYKQTVLGPAWILINPLMSTAMYCVMFGTIAQLSTDGVPQILFYLAGTALWGFFSSCINKVSGTFTTNSNIFSKVYFPRLAMPISTVISGLINFLVQFALFFILLLVYLAKGEVSPHWGMLLLCVPLVLQVGLLGLGCGIIVSSRSPRSVPPPICPKRYCFFTFSTRIINEFSRILAPPYTVSTKVFSTLLKSDSPSASSATVQISDDAHMTPVTCPVPKKI